ncbi:MFS transporter [Motilibacter deserti]|uniref:MFS transporter n=1 Tax=Motilibacter deserti TaxID=2714956 RepID=A0ABX0GT57_9ACTN|nr:MFS transporter [Motilibacter deserti]
MSTAATGSPTTQAAPPDPRRWWALAVIALAQLMVVLDGTIVNIALPDAQRELGISDVDRQWVVTAYALAFGGLLLLGGRIADYWGRKRTFVVGMAGFAIASAVGGLAQTGFELYAARALQGVFGALLAPASLALLTVTFTEGRERAKAFGVYGAIAGGGAAIGLVLGGVLTEYADWRWCLLVNIPVAAIAVAAAIPLVSESKAHGDTRYDVPGAVVVTAGLVALVYGFTKAGEEAYGWSSAVSLGFIAAGVVLLAVFVVIEKRSNHPLLPLRIPLHPSRGGTYIASLLAGAGLLGALLFLTFYFQIVLGYSPIKSGIASLPLTAAVLATAGFATAMMTRTGPKPLMAAGGLVAASGMAVLSQIGVESAYATHVLPGLVLIGIGLGLLFVPLSNVALVGVEEHDAGAASALINATQQVGGAVGTALLSSFYSSSVTSYLESHAPSPALQFEAFVHGYSTAFWWGAAILALAAAVVLALVRVTKEELPTDAVVHVG